MKTYVLTVSRVFPCTHKRKGEQTYFPEKLLTAVYKHETYTLLQCDDCANSFYSCCADGGGQIADTGDYGDIYCPKCGSTNLSDVEVQDELIYYKQSVNVWPKLHTIRANKKGTAFDNWSKKVEQIQKGEAILSIRYWSGKPYNSKQVEICQLDKDSGIGVQKVTIENELKFGYIEIHPEYSGMKPIPIFEDGRASGIAKNDGLSLEDFKEWFKGYDLSKPMAIIHFTKFRY